MTNPNFRESGEARLAALACVHVAQGWLECTGTSAGAEPGAGERDFPSGSEAGARAGMPSSDTACFPDFVPVATRLCELEALAHRTSDVEEELASVRVSCAALAPRVLRLLPSGFPPRALRAFAGLVAAQREWLEEVGWEGADARERNGWLPESPSRAWDALIPFQRENETTNGPGE